MILDLHEKYDVSPEWFETQVKNALRIASPDVVEKLALPRLCELLAVYRCQDETEAKKSVARMKALINSSQIDAAME